MRSIRLAVAAVATAAILVPLFGGVAGAQSSVTGTTTCVTNAETGDFDVTITINNLIAQEGTLFGQWDSLGPGGEGPGGDLTFTPATLPASGGSSATFSVPSDITDVGGQVVVTYTEAGQASYLIDGTGDLTEICGPAQATTTTTAAPTTTTTAAAAAAVAQPRFTG